MNNHFNTIDPTQSNLSDFAVIEKVISEEDRLPDSQHEKAAKAFLLSDSIASGIAKDFAFVKKIPQYIKEIIENKLWGCLYVAKGVVTPYYCRYTKGTDSENFRAFITAKRPNGLETTIDEVDNLLNSDPEVQRQFRTLIYESRQGERTDLIDDETSGLQVPKLELEERQQKRIRATNRAAEAIPIIGELLDRGIIAIDLAAKLGRDIKDPENLTADEREYIENRDLIGLRIKEYTHSNPIPEDEYKEPAYSRELNRFVKDLLGIKDRSKQVRMDHPKKATDKLLQFYKGDELQTLIDYLQRGLEDVGDSPESTVGEKKLLPPGESTPVNSNQNGAVTPTASGEPGNMPQADKTTEIDINQETEVTDSDENNQADSEVDEFTNSPVAEVAQQSKELDISQETEIQSIPLDEDNQESPEASESTTSTNSEILKEANQSTDSFNLSEMRLTTSELAKRLGLQPQSLTNAVSRQKEAFPEWSKKRDPDGISWQRSNEKKGIARLFIPMKG